ncbi:MAG: Mfa1 fimbrilin C-terminal domain-containing protein [Tidjanibacter sp.]|nr:Mfa1 fimbrilin C-terminal domain-containing protein [Tidjanibacter sp.]
MKKYLLIALAAFGFAACAENQDDINNPAIGGEVEESYIAINLMSADSDTRAITNDPEGDAELYGYEYGTSIERKVERAHFFFFLNGEPFNVNATPATEPGVVTAPNHMELVISTTGEDDDPAGNISDISNAVLVLSTYKGQYPNQIVAVLNWAPEARVYTLDELREEISAASLGNDENGYVMSNSVYMDSEVSKQVIDVTPITSEHIKDSADKAIDAPVDIYVERTAAKVVVTASAANDNIFQVTDDDGFIPVGATRRTVYVELLGWELYNEFTETNLIKQIDTDLTPSALGLTWNDAPYFRSYWATTMNERTTNDTFLWEYEADASPATTFGGGFPTAYGYEVASAADYTNRNSYTYCGENTLAWTKTNDVRTKVILKGRLVESDGAGGYNKLELARWYGNEYAGTDDLKTAVANSIKYTLYDYDEVNRKYISISPEDLEIVHGSDVNAEAYEVGFQLSTPGEGKNWYTYSAANGYQPVGDASIPGDIAAKTNAILATTVQPAILYKGGNTYYIVDIEHLGKDGSTSQFGIVRNHVYQIDVQSISGYGSPGYSGDSYLENPEYPEVDDDDSSFVAARINVLSWKVVKQSVNIGQ